MLLLSPTSMKWGGITLPSLATAAKTITEAGFLFCITGGTSEGPEATTRVLRRFATSTTTNCFSSWFRIFRHLSALRILERIVKRLRTLLSYYFIPRSSFTALMILLRLTLRFCASFDNGWLGSDFNVLFSSTRNILVLLLLCRLLWTLFSASKAATTR